jgi:hypothetical protein
MEKKFKLGDQEYDATNLSERGQATLAHLNFTSVRIQELSNMQALLQRAKNSYVDQLKKEMLSSKSGFSFGDDW